MALDVSPTTPQSPGIVNPVIPDRMGMQDPPRQRSGFVSMHVFRHLPVPGCRTFGEEVLLEFGIEVSEHFGAGGSLVQAVVNDRTRHAFQIAHAIDPVWLTISCELLALEVNWSIVLTSHGYSVIGWFLQFWTSAWYMEWMLCL